MLDTLMLSRMQFALNISFHILFPMITIALCWFLLYFKIRYLRSGDEVWQRAYRFWVKVFALSFALGVVSGVTMSFQFGTNWPGYMDTVGNIAGPLLGYEVLTAFFLEATFLGVMLFGTGRVSPKLHTFATATVAVGTTVSAFWILSLNSWMHTPTGHSMTPDGALPTDWFAVVFNPSLPYRLGHTLLASGLTAAFLIAGLSAYRILRGDSKHAPRLALRTALFAAAILAPLQIAMGDLHGLNTLQHQPQKVAAMEGLWETRSHAPLLLFGFRLMVGMGLLMLAVAWFASLQLVRGRELPRWLLRMLVGMTFAGWVASLAGWYVTEIGRQPWLVWGILRTSDAVTDVPLGNVVASFSLYAVLSAGLLASYVHVLFRMARQSVEVEEYESQDRPGDSARAHFSGRTV